MHTEGPRYRLNEADSEIMAKFLGAEVVRRLEGDPSQSPIRVNPPSDRFMLGILYPPGKEIVKEEDGEDQGGITSASDEDADFSTVLLGSRRVRPQRVGLMFLLRNLSGHVPLDLGFDVWRRIPDDDAGRPQWAFLERVTAKGTVDLADLPESGRRLTASLMEALRSAAERATAEGAYYAPSARRQGREAGPVRPDWSAEVVTRAERRSDGDTRVIVELINTTRPGPALKAYVEGAYLRPKVHLDLRGLGQNVVRKAPAEIKLRTSRRKPSLPLGYGIACVAREDESTAGVLATNLTPTFAQPKIEHERKPGTTLTELAADAWAACERFAASMREYANTEWAGVRATLAQSSDLEDFDRDWASFRDEVRRVEEAVGLLHPTSGDPNVRLAFAATIETLKEMNEARRQARAADREVRDPIEGLRPFQLAYLLGSIPDVLGRADAAKRNDPTHAVPADLLWFPTGGGKTEAFQLTALFNAFHDRLRGKTTGVTCWLRFALRTLTVQQTERLMELVWHAEKVRRRRGIGPSGSVFQIGLLVGEAYTPTEVLARSSRPNEQSRTRATIEANIAQSGGRSYVYTPRCPECHRLTIRSRFNEQAWDIQFGCQEPTCAAKLLPLTVIDDAIRRRPTAFVVGTIDKITGIGLTRKFHSLLRSPRWTCPVHGAVRARRKSGALLPCAVEMPNKCGRPLVEMEPQDWGPGLMVTDEVHLLEEELGAFAAQYESALAEIQRMGGFPAAKPILASATVAEYEKHVAQLTGRLPRRFPGPPPTKGRSYYFQTLQQTQRLLIGLHPHGKTESNAIMFTLRALHGTLADMLKSESACFLDGLLGRRLTDDERLRALRPYAVSIPYILALKQGDNLVNSLQTQMPDLLEEVGGAPIRVEEILSSRLDPTTLSGIITELGRDDPNVRFDTLPASSSIAYGVDIPNINSMVLVGQPRRTSEDIQVTSRTGRRYTGLILRLFHPVRERDQTHYRLFDQYHENQDLLVEGVPINRFAIRSVGRTMPGVLMALLFASDEDRNGDLDAWFASGARTILAKPTVRDHIGRSVRRIYQVGTHEVFDRQVESSLELNVGLITDPDQAYSDNTRDRLQATPMLSLRDVDEGIDIVHLTRGTRPELLSQAGIANQMKRSRAQIVYGHTPMSVYSYQGGRAVVRTVGVRADPIRGNLDLVDLRSVVPRISHLIRPMAAFKRLGGPKNWHDAVADQLELVRPGIVFCKIFPTVLRCQHESCQNVWEIDPEREDLKCAVCLRHGRRTKDGRVPIGTQIRHVAIHHCGKMEPIRVQRCARHPGEPMRLDTVNQRVANWRWECTKCDFKDQPIQVCFDCRQAVDEPDDGVAPTEEVEGHPVQGVAP